MSIELISEKHHEEIEQLFTDCEESILIISPFIGRKTSQELSHIIKDNGVHCKLITRFYREDFIQGASSLDGLIELLDAGVTIYALKQLHTKLYIFDQFASIITSANFTYGGLSTNFELGIKITEEDDLIEKCISYYDELWNEITIYNQENNNVGLITYKMIELEKAEVRSQINTRGNKSYNYNNYCQGANLKIKKARDNIEDVFSNTLPINKIDKTLKKGWIKFEADAKHRHDPKITYFEGQEKHNRNKTFFPLNKKPRGIKPDQKIYLALVSYDKSGFEVPMIVGRAYSDGFQEDYIMKKGMLGWEEWMTDYPNYVFLKNGKFIKAAAENGISMTEIYSQIGARTYPSTYYKKHLPVEELKHYHYRKDKVRITKDVEDYLDDKLEKLFREFGCEEI